MASGSKETTRTEARREAVLVALKNSLSLTGAAEMAGISYGTLNRWRKEDDTFNKEIEEAIEMGTDTLEDAAMVRAKAQSDTLAIFFLKARRRDKYTERVINYNANVNYSISDKPLSDEEFEATLQYNALELTKDEYSEVANSEIGPTESRDPEAESN